MKTRFTLTKSSDEKQLLVLARPGVEFNLQITIDYDDVNHNQVDKEAKELVEILNESWPLNPHEVV